MGRNYRDEDRFGADDHEELEEEDDSGLMQRETSGKSTGGSGQGRQTPTGRTTRLRDEEVLQRRMENRELTISDENMTSQLEDGEAEVSSSLGDSEMNPNGTRGGTRRNESGQPLWEEHLTEEDWAIMRAVEQWYGAPSKH